MLDTYVVGLFGSIIMEKHKDNIFHYRQIRHKENVLLVCNKDEKVLKILKMKNECNQCQEADEDIEKSVVRQISEDGSRWEGDWYNQQPFGFGSVYDGEGNRIYSGFMFEGKKIGFGTEYFADNHNVDYCGNFMNDKRHGWGTTYDRNGQKLYEGDWRFGKKFFEDRIVIEENCEEDGLENS